MAYLSDREQAIGGYTTIIAQFYPRDPKEEPFPVLVYIALPCNPLFLGSASLDQMARDIAHSKGICGPNVEYLAKLAAFMKIHIPHESDDHLYRLEDLVRNILQLNDDLKTLLKLFDDAFANEFNDQTVLKSLARSLDSLDIEDSNQTYLPSSSSSSASSESLLSSVQPSKYSDRVTARKLRCINKY